MKQRAPIRAPSPTYACAADLRGGSMCGARRDRRRRMHAGIRAADPDAATSPRARKWHGDWRRSGPATGESAADFASRMTAPARVSASCATYLGLARKVIDRGPACDKRRDGIHDRRRIAAQLTAETDRQFAERHGHGGRRAPRRGARSLGLRGWLRGRRRRACGRRQASSFSTFSTAVVMSTAGVA